MLSVKPKRLEASPAVTMVTAVCIVNIVKIFKIKYVIKKNLPIL